MDAGSCYKQSVLSLSLDSACGSTDSCQAQSAFGRAQACLNQSVNFWNLSTGMYNTYSWKVNGIEVATTSNMQYTFTSTGTYVVELGVGTDGKICSNSSQTIVLPETAGPISGEALVCRGQDYIFSIDPNPNAYYNWWLNGDGNVISGQGTHQATIHIGDYFNTSTVKVGVNIGACYKESAKVLEAVNCSSQKMASGEALLNIIPHPFENQTSVSLETGEAIINVKVFSLNGLEIFNAGKVNKEVVTIGETLTAGYYIIHVTTEKGIYIKTLLKY